MGYDLIPKNNDAGSPRGMIFTWPMILNETGACYLFGYGQNTINRMKYFYDGSRGPGSPVSNDGFEVSEDESKTMAKLFRGYVDVKRSIREEWDKLTEEQKNVHLSINGNAEPPSNDFLDKIENLIGFCDTSGGFKIH